MARYKLFGFDGLETSYDELQNKLSWCSQGEVSEKGFVDRFNSLNSMGKISNCLGGNQGFVLDIHPAKTSNPYHPDLLQKYSCGNASVIAEAKVKTSPLFIASKYGLHPQYALTIDLKDIFNYQRRLNPMVFGSEAVNLVVYIWVDWFVHKMVKENSNGWRSEYPTVNPMEGIWWCHFNELNQHIKSSRAPIHWYHDRPPKSFHSEDPWHKAWLDEIIAFEPRLQNGNKVKNLTTGGYSTFGDLRYPSGNSSASYVLDLNSPVFRKVYLDHRTVGPAPVSIV